MAGYNQEPRMSEPPARPPARSGPKSDRQRPEAPLARDRNLGDKALAALAQ